MADEHGDSRRVSRRKAMVGGAAAVGSVWVAPIVMTSAAGAGAVPSEVAGACATLTKTRCIHAFPPDAPFELTSFGLSLTNDCNVGVIAFPFDDLEWAERLGFVIVAAAGSTVGGSVIVPGGGPFTFNFRNADTRLPIPGLGPVAIDGC